MLQVEHVFMEVFCSHTCASIKNRGISEAQRLLHGYLKDTKGTKYCLQVDVSKFYPSIDHEILKKLLTKKFKDKQLLSLLNKIIDSSPNEKGVPIGSYLSQYLANYYLAYLDHFIKETLGMKYVVRYMDDIIILSDSKEQLHQVREIIDEYLKHNLNLHLKDNWQIYEVDKRGIDFIGFRSFHGYTLLRKRTCQKFKRKMNKIKQKQDAGQLINYSEWCSANSYNGWLDMCDGYRLWLKYVVPVLPSMVGYYEKVVVKDRKPHAKIIAIDKYKKKITVKKGWKAA
jgi:retron-type reverse transcriptase